jgi:hypothetical protein
MKVKLSLIEKLEMVDGQKILFLETIFIFLNFYEHVDVDDDKDVE